MRMSKISGVYKITNSVTGDFYVGSSNDVKHRWACHKSPSTWALHPKVKLYQAFIKYGLDNFIFEIIEETLPIKEREQYFIDQLKPNYNDKRAEGWNTERHRETSRRANRVYCKAHRANELARTKAYQNRLCLYQGVTLTLGTLSMRFRRQGIYHPTTEAKKYLIEGEN